MSLTSLLKFNHHAGSTAILANNAFQSQFGGARRGMADRAVHASYTEVKDRYVTLRRQMGWDGIRWDGAGWVGFRWDGVGSNGMGWVVMGSNGIGWNGMGWDEMRSDRMGWDGMG